MCSPTCRYARVKDLWEFLNLCEKVGESKCLTQSPTAYQHPRKVSPATNFLTPEPSLSNYVHRTSSSPSPLQYLPERELYANSAHGACAYRPVFLEILLA